MLYKTCNVVGRLYNAPSRTASTASFRERKVLPVDPTMRLLRFRAIGCLEMDGPNGNWDSFPYDDFEDETPGYGYKSFINKRAHYEHNSHLSLKGSIGDLPDAYLNRFIFPQEHFQKKWADLLPKAFTPVRRSILEMPNQRDGSIEVLMRIDTTLTKSSYLDREVRSALERICRMIDTGQKLTCSMGTNIRESVCSVCGNTARFSEDYCEHIKPRKKGSLFVVSANDIRDLLDKEKLRPEWLKYTVLNARDIDEVLNGASNRGLTVRAHEINHGTSFFELSIVGTPAFTRADQLEKIARKNNETRSEYLKRIAADLSNDDVMDIYEILQSRGLISSQCSAV